MLTLREFWNEFVSKSPKPPSIKQKWFIPFKQVLLSLSLYILMIKWRPVILSHQFSGLSGESCEFIYGKSFENNFWNKTTMMKPWLVWLSGLSVSLWTRGSPVQFPVGAHAWVLGQVPRRGCMRGNHTLMFLSFLSPVPSRKINKWNIFKSCND